MFVDERSLLRLLALGFVDEMKNAPCWLWLLLWRVSVVIFSLSSIKCSALSTWVKVMGTGSVGLRNACSSRMRWKLLYVVS